MAIRLKVVMLSAAILWTASVCGAQGIRADEIGGLAGEVKLLAEKWLLDQASEEEVAPLARKFKSSTYDEGSAAPLSSLLKKADKTAQGLYVANWLINPLQLAKTEAIRKALDEVKKTRLRLAIYGDPKQYNRKLPPKDGPASPARSKTARERQEELIAALNVLKKHSQEVHKLNVATFKLMLLADQPAEDKELIELMKKYEKEGQWEYTEVVAAISSSARTLGAKRAETFYDAMLEYGAKVKDKKGAYAAAHEMTVSDTDGGVVPTKADYPGWRILKAVNKLAPVAKKPAVNVPGRPEDSRPRRGRRDRGRDRDSRRQ